jgi:hypothetical protein
MAKIVLGDALAGLGAAVFLVDSLGRVVFMNVRGETLLGDALVLKGKRLSARNRGRSSFTGMIRRSFSRHIFSLSRQYSTVAL